MGTLLYTELISSYIWSSWECFKYPELEVSSQSVETLQKLEATKRSALKH